MSRNRSNLTRGINQKTKYSAVINPLDGFFVTELDGACFSGPEVGHIIGLQWPAERGYSQFRSLTECCGV